MKLLPTAIAALFCLSFLAPSVECQVLRGLAQGNPDVSNVFGVPFPGRGNAPATPPAARMTKPCLLLQRVVDYKTGKDEAFWDCELDEADDSTKKIVNIVGIDVENFGRE